MPTLTADNRPSAVPSRDARRPSERRPARWWWAGLLVGCLLPAGLAQVELRPAERLVQVCILAPALIRARTHLRARRRSLVRRACRRLQRVGQRGLGPRSHPAPLQRAVAAQDVLTRRGPPRVA